MYPVPRFNLYGEGQLDVEERIQPTLNFRDFNDLNNQERQTAYQELVNRGWVTKHSNEILYTIDYLNHNFLRECPGKNLHAIPPDRDRYGYGNVSDRQEAAASDFFHLFVNERGSKFEPLFLRMISVFCKAHINSMHYGWAETAKTAKLRNENIANAFVKFDELANCLNHIFEQFAVNVVVTRNGIVPRQDEKINAQIYVPTLAVLADPKWKDVNSSLGSMFDAFHDKNFPLVITLAHTALHGFLQTLTGNGTTNAKGEVAKLFASAKKANLIPTNMWSEQIVTVFQGFIVSERATKSAAKPMKEAPTSNEALLVMNTLLVFLQYALKETTS